MNSAEQTAGIPFAVGRRAIKSWLEERHLNVRKATSSCRQFKLLPPRHAHHLARMTGLTRTSRDGRIERASGRHGVVRVWQNKEDIIIYSRLRFWSPPHTPDHNTNKLIKHPMSNRTKELLAMSRDRLRVEIGLLTGHVILRPTQIRTCQAKRMSDVRRRKGIACIFYAIVQHSLVKGTVLGLHIFWI